MGIQDPADEVVGPVAFPQPGELVDPTWGRAVAGRLAARYRTVAERDAEGVPPNGAICHVDATGWTYWASGGVWTPANVLFSAVAGVNHAAFSAVTATPQHNLATVAIPVRNGTAVRWKINVQTWIDFASANTGDGWALDVVVNGVARSRTRVQLPRTGGLSLHLFAQWTGNVTVTQDNPTVLANLVRLSGTATATGVVDGTLSRTIIEYGAAFPMLAP